MTGARLRKYGVEATIDFELFEIDGVDLRVDWTPAAADCEIMKDGGASTQCDNTATDEGSTYSIILTATEMEAARLVLKVVDAATKVFLDKVVHIETYGHGSAQHAMDFDDAVRGGMTALPNAAADAAGGLPISDAGGLDMDVLAELRSAQGALLRHVQRLLADRTRSPRHCVRRRRRLQRPCRDRDRPDERRAGQCPAGERLHQRWDSDSPRLGT